MSRKDHLGRFMGDARGMAKMATELSDLVEQGSPPRKSRTIDAQFDWLDKAQMLGPPPGPTLMIQRLKIFSNTIRI